jgi:SpoVK/Ycf46/Vps4 family AAA+-type ATPase
MQGQTVPSAILLEGPPGTGKSMSVRALANDCDGVFLNVPIGTYMKEAKWLGNVEGNIDRLFIFAKAKHEETGQHVFLFLDEIEQLGKRGSHEAIEKAQRIIQTHMEGFDGRIQGVTLIGATNYPDQLSEAFKARFPRIVEYSLPEGDALAEVAFKCISKFEKTRQGKFFDITEEDRPSLVDYFKGFSQREIRDAIEQVVQIGAQVVNGEAGERGVDLDQAERELAEAGDNQDRINQILDQYGLKVMVNPTNFSDYLGRTETFREHSRPKKKGNGYNIDFLNLFPKEG